MGRFGRARAIKICGSRRDRRGHLFDDARIGQNESAESVGCYFKQLESVTAATVAARGSPVSRHISPKKSPEASRDTTW